MKDRTNLFDEHLLDFELGWTDSEELVEALGEPTERLDNEPLLQLLYRDGRRSSLGQWELVAFTFYEDQLRIVTWYEPSPAVPRDGPLAEVLGQPDESFDGLALGWGLAEGHARCESFPFELEEEVTGVLITGTDRLGNLQYLALSCAGPEEERTEVACPICGWHPPIADGWACDGCGAEFDTFETRATCPTCDKRWETTQCNACGTYSPHGDWWL